MKRIILLLILLLVFINAGAREYFEKGDALFRDFKKYGVHWGHTGIYWYWDTDKDPANREAHWEIESSTEIPDTSHPEGVWSFTFKEFYERTTFWSVRTMSGLDWRKRNLIVETAEHFYVRRAGYDGKDGYKNPNGSPPTFRCDGLVEYCYEIALGDPWEPGNNGGIIQNDTWFNLEPEKQMLALELRESAELHYINIELPVEGYTIKGSFILSVLASDGLFGSGTERVEFYVDDNLVGTDAHEHNTADWYNYEWDSRTVANGEHTLSVKGYDQAGNDNEAQVTFSVDNSIPRVVSTDPENGAVDVDVYSDIVISFNRQMDQSTVNSGTVLFNPPLHGSFTTEWSGDGKTVTLTLTNPEEDLEFYTNYTVTVTDGAKDTSGTQLDGDRDGEPGGNYVFDFTTRSPEFDLSLDPWLSKIKIGETDTIEVSVTNTEERDISVSLSYIPEYAPNWIITLGGGVSVPAGETVETTLLVTNLGEPGSINITVKGKSYEREKSASAFVWSSEHYEEPNEPPHGLDENYSISNPNMPSPWLLNPYAKVGILLSGYTEGMGHLLGRYKIATAIVLGNFEILGASERVLSDLDVFIVPSGGLIPYYNLPPFRSKLQEYTEQGGKLICFTQSHGEVFEALPGSPSGYGWREDKSCWRGAGYFSDWDVILSG